MLEDNNYHFDAWIYVLFFSFKLKYNNWIGDSQMYLIFLKGPGAQIINVGFLKNDNSSQIEVGRSNTLNPTTSPSPQITDSPFAIGRSESAFPFHVFPTTTQRVSVYQKITCAKRKGQLETFLSAQP